MFSSKEKLKIKTGPDNIGRYEYLKQLVVEFNTTKILESKHQILANLANFAYDPVNYEYMKQLHIIDLFLAQLSENNGILIHFGLAGICNICLEPECKEYIITLNGIKLISDQLSNRNEEIALNALTTLYYLLTDCNHLITTEIIKRVTQFKFSDNPRFKNLALIFLSICPSEQISATTTK